MDKTNKFYSTLAIFASIILFASCSKDKDVPSVSDKKIAMTFSIASSNGPSTRAHINGGINQASPAVYWDMGDEITIFEGNHTSGDTFTCTKLGSGFGNFDNVAEFNGYSYEGNSYVAVYPASTNAKFDGNKSVTFTIPSHQKAINDSFDPKGAIQLGRSKADGAIDLKHVTAALYIEIEEGLECMGISVNTGATNWAMTGTVTATVGSEGNTIDPNSISDKSSTVYLTDIPNGAGTYMMSIIPTTSNPAITLTITYKNSKGEIKHYTRLFNATSSFVVGNMYSLGKYRMGDDDKPTYQ